MGILFFFSLCLVGYAVFGILSGPLHERKALADWERKQQTLANPGAKEQPITEGLVTGERINPQSGEVLHSPASKASNSTHTSGDSASEFLPPKKGEVFGTLTIPRLDKKLALLEGTDSAELAKGVGHYTGSAFPTEKGNVVLAGHRDSVFRRLGELVKGDKLILETAEGKATYRMTSHQIVDGDDREAVVLGDQPELTLITCYPFSYIGNAPKRYIVTGVPDDSP